VLRKWDIIVCGQQGIGRMVSRGAEDVGHHSVWPAGGLADGEQGC